jgi:hypothetical protein
MASNEPNKDVQEALKRVASSEVDRQARGSNLELSASKVTEAELETIKDVLVRLKPRPPTRKTWTALVVPLGSPLLLIAKILKDALANGNFTLGFWNLAFLLGAAAAVAAVVKDYSDHNKASDAAAADDAPPDTHYNRAIEYADRLTDEAKAFSVAMRSTRRPPGASPIRVPVKAEATAAGVRFTNVEAEANEAQAVLEQEEQALLEQEEQQERERQMKGKVT